MNRRRAWSSVVILILTTGGTIDKQYFDALSEFQIGESVAGQTLKIARATHPFRILELMRKDSLDLTSRDRQLIVETVESAAEKFVIITHGTDTIAETARALSNHSGKTIVLVGALTPAAFYKSDATFNLGMAFACCQIAPSGVYITMNGTVFEGDKVTKDRENGVFRFVEATPLR